MVPSLAGQRGHLEEAVQTTGPSQAEPGFEPASPAPEVRTRDRTGPLCYMGFVPQPITTPPGQDTHIGIGHWVQSPQAQALLKLWWRQAGRQKIDSVSADSPVPPNTSRVQPRGCKPAALPTLPTATEGCKGPQQCHCSRRLPQRSANTLPSSPAPLLPLQRCQVPSILPAAPSSPGDISQPCCCPTRLCQCPSDTALPSLPSHEALSTPSAP